MRRYAQIQASPILDKQLYTGMVIAVYDNPVIRDEHISERMKREFFMYVIKTDEEFEVFKLASEEGTKGQFRDYIVDLTPIINELGPDIIDRIKDEKEMVDIFESQYQALLQGSIQEVL